MPPNGGVLIQVHDRRGPGMLFLPAVTARGYEMLLDAWAERALVQVPAAVPGGRVTSVRLDTRTITLVFPLFQVNMGEASDRDTSGAAGSGEHIQGTFGL